MTTVIHASPSDSPGYTHLVLAEALGSTTASAVVVAHDSDVTPILSGDLAIQDGLDEKTRSSLLNAHALEKRVRPYLNVKQTLHLHGQREFDVIEGLSITFPDGTVWTPAS